MAVLTLAGIDLSRNMHWANPGWSPVGQSIQYASDGSLYITENARAGRRFVLALNPDCDLPEAKLQAIQALADVVDATYTLTIGSSSYTVRFYRAEGDPVEVTPLDPGLDDPYFDITIRLIEVP